MIGFIIGLSLGACLGVVMTGLCVAAARAQPHQATHPAITLADWEMRPGGMTPPARATPPDTDPDTPGDI